jgi:hypothetical protein
MEEKEGNGIVNSAFVQASYKLRTSIVHAFIILFIFDMILNALRDMHPNLVDVLKSCFHSYYFRHNTSRQS